MLKIKYELLCDWCQKPCDPPTEWNVSTPHPITLPQPSLAPWIFGAWHMCHNCQKIAKDAVVEKVAKA